MEYISLDLIQDRFEDGLVQTQKEFIEQIKRDVSDCKMKKEGLSMEEVLEQENRFNFKRVDKEMEEMRKEIKNAGILKKFDLAKLDFYLYMSSFYGKECKFIKEDQVRQYLYQILPQILLKYDIKTNIEFIDVFSKAFREELTLQLNYDKIKEAWLRLLFPLNESIPKQLKENNDYKEGLKLFTFKLFEVLDYRRLFQEKIEKFKNNYMEVISSKKFADEVALSIASIKVKTIAEMIVDQMNQKKAERIAENKANIKAEAETIAQIIFEKIEERKAKKKAEELAKQKAEELAKEQAEEIAQQKAHNLKQKKVKTVISKNVLLRKNSEEHINSKSNWQSILFRYGTGLGVLFYVLYKVHSLFQIHSYK